MSSQQFGWYYDGGHVQGESDDLWELLDEAVGEAVCDGDLGRLLVGEMHSLSVDELLDVDDVVSLADYGKLKPWRIAELVSERCGERIYDGCARLTCSDGEAEPSLRAVLSHYTDLESAAPAVVDWARDHIELDPSEYCDGRYPLPIDYVDGEWRFGVDGDDAPSVCIITYATVPSPETGHVGWCWWALGRMGEAKTLREAMRAAWLAGGATLAEGIRRKMAELERLVQTEAERMRVACRDAARDEADLWPEGSERRDTASAIADEISLVILDEPAGADGAPAPGLVVCEAAKLLAKARGGEG